MEHNATQQRTTQQFKTKKKENKIQPKTSTANTKPKRKIKQQQKLAK